MNVSVAIHARDGSFSDRWIQRAAAIGMGYRIVDCHGSGVLDELRPHAALLWHWTHTSLADQLVARHVIRGAENLGLRVFPSSDTCWTFDDKIAQKYQLEAVGAPLAHTDCFFSETAALEWVAKASFPRVLKLRRGAGSENVLLVHDRQAARKYVRRAFHEGFPASPGPLADARRLIARAEARRDLLGPVLRLPRTLLAARRNAQELGPERGYVYFQEFLPGNRYDVRVTVIGNRAFSFSRNVRTRDFRASGSGSIDYSPQRVSPEALKIAFEVSAKIRSQSAAFDFAFDAEHKPRILEVSYCYQDQAVHDCPGYWDEALNFVPGHVWPQDAILDDLIASVMGSPTGERDTCNSPPRGAPAHRGARI